MRHNIPITFTIAIRSIHRYIKKFSRKITKEILKEQQIFNYETIKCTIRFIN